VLREQDLVEIDEVRRETGIGIERINSLITKMEMDGLIDYAGGSKYVIKKF